jgi:hypothetical protein
MVHKSGERLDDVGCALSQAKKNTWPGGNTHRAKLLKGVEDVFMLHLIVPLVEPQVRMIATAANVAIVRTLLPHDGLRKSGGMARPLLISPLQSLVDSLTGQVGPTSLLTTAPGLFSSGEGFNSGLLAVLSWLGR